MDMLNGKDFYNLPLDDIKVLVNKVSNQANQQIKELEDSGYFALSSAYRSLQSRQGKDNPSFSTNLEGLTKPQLYGRYVSAVNFMSLKTSNVEGTKETNVEIYKNMGYSKEKAEKIVEDIAMDEVRKFKDKPIWTDKQYDEFNDDYGFDIKEFWKNYHRMEQLGMSASYGSFFVQSKLKTYMVQKGNNVNADKFRDFLEEEYQRENEEDYREEQEENERLWGEDIEDDF